MYLLSKFYTGCHKYVPIDQRLNFRAHRGYNLKRSTARCAKIKELDLAMLGTQTRLLQNAPFCPISVLGSNFNPRNTECMTVVKIFACLELEQN